MQMCSDAPASSTPESVRSAKRTGACARCFIGSKDTIEPPRDSTVLAPQEPVLVPLRALLERGPRGRLPRPRARPRPVDRRDPRGSVRAEPRDAGAACTRARAARGHPRPRRRGRLRGPRPPRAERALELSPDPAVARGANGGDAGGDVPRGEAVGLE